MAARRRLMGMDILIFLPKRKDRPDAGRVTLRR